MAKTEDTVATITPITDGLKFKLTPMESMMILSGRFGYLIELEQTQTRGPWKIQATPIVGRSSKVRLAISKTHRSLDKVADMVQEAMLEQE